jgi:hypothetical protein
MSQMVKGIRSGGGGTPRYRVSRLPKGFGIRLKHSRLEEKRGVRAKGIIPFITLNPKNPNNTPLARAGGGLGVQTL